MTETIASFGTWSRRWRRPRNGAVLAGALAGGIGGILVNAHFGVLADLPTLPFLFHGVLLALAAEWALRPVGSVAGASQPARAAEHGAGFLALEGWLRFSWILGRSAGAGAFGGAAAMVGFTTAMARTWTGVIDPWVWSRGALLGVPVLLGLALAHLPLVADPRGASRLCVLFLAGGFAAAGEVPLWLSPWGFDLAAGDAWLPLTRGWTFGILFALGTGLFRPPGVPVSDAPAPCTRTSA